MARTKRSRKSKKEDDKAANPATDGVEFGPGQGAAKTNWLWPGAIPSGSIVLLEGRKGVGKSSIAAAIAAAVSGGPKPPGWADGPGGAIVWSSSEDPWEEVTYPRLIAAGAKPEMLGRLVSLKNAESPRPIALPGDIAAVQAIVVECRVKLLILDPFISLAGSTIDLRVEQQARLYLDPISEVCRQSGCVALLVRHIRKGSFGDVREAGLGSVAIGNAARSILRCDENRHRPGEFYLSVVSCNYGQKMATKRYRLASAGEGAVRVEWIGDSPETAEEIAAGQGSDADIDEYTDACSLLLGVIGNDFIAYREIAAVATSAGIGERTLRRAKARLKVRSKQVRAAGKSFWQWGPPEAGWPADLA